MENSLWNNLVDKEVMELLIGDLPIKDGLYTNLYKMPYMKGTDIEDFAEQLGISNEEFAEKEIGQSRWQMMNDVTKYSIKNNIMNDFFKNLINKKRFQYLAKQDHIETFNSPLLIYFEIINGLFEKINSILSFCDCHIEYNLDTNIYNISKDAEQVEVMTEAIKDINKSYINRIVKEIENTIRIHDYNSATTKSRTIIEETLIYGLRKRNIQIEANGNINKLFNQFKEVYDIKTGKELDKRVNTINSSLWKIIESIANLRNDNSDSHGVGDDKRFILEERHIRLLANSSIIITNYLLELINDDNGKT